MTKLPSPPPGTLFLNVTLFLPEIVVCEEYQVCRDGDKNHGLVGSHFQEEVVVFHIKQSHHSNPKLSCNRILI